MPVTKQLALDVENDDTLIAAVKRALADPKWDFHTVQGLARTVGVAPAAIERVLDEHPKLVHPIPARKDGRWLYADGSRRRSWRATLITIRAYAAKEVTDYYSDTAEALA